MSEVGHPQSTMSSPYRLDDCCKSVLLFNKPKPSELSQKKNRTENRSSSSFHTTFHKYPQPRSGKLAFGSFFIKCLSFSKWKKSHLLLFYDFISMACYSHQLASWLPTTKRCRFFYASNTWDHRLSTSARLKLNITFLLSENSEYILLTTASRASNSQKCWVKIRN